MLTQLRALRLTCWTSIVFFAAASAVFVFYALHEFAEASGPSRGFYIPNPARLSNFLSFLLGYLAPVTAMIVMAELSFSRRDKFRVISRFGGAVLWLLTFLGILSFGSFVAHMLSRSLSEIVWWMIK